MKPKIKYASSPPAAMVLCKSSMVTPNRRDRSRRPRRNGEGDPGLFNPKVDAIVWQQLVALHRPDHRRERRSGKFIPTIESMADPIGCAARLGSSAQVQMAELTLVSSEQRYRLSAQLCTRQSTTLLPNLANFRVFQDAPLDIHCPLAAGTSRRSPR